MLNGKKSYNFSDKTHPRDGKLATVIGIMTIAVLLFLAGWSIYYKGHSGRIVGLLGFIDMIAAFVGIVFAIAGLSQEDSLYLFPRIGLVLNSLVLLATIALLLVGLFL